MDNNKLKVVWLCYFTNAEIQDKLKPYKRINEIAPWINNMIPLFENDENIELHVVSQHRWISGYKSFQIRGITYHFYNAGIPFIGRHWPGFFRFDYWTDFIQSKRYVAGIVKKIDPDIIHMHGAENDFCCTINQFFNKFPVFISIQGFIHKSSANTKGAVRKSKTELMILKKFSHFGHCTETLGNDIMRINPTANLHYHDYPIEIPASIKVEKKYDLVFFARVTKDKGIDDLLQAVDKIKAVQPKISLCVIGGGKLGPWKKRADELGISGNVYWAGFLPTQKDVYKLASASKISVLPTYHDVMPGTVIESLFLKIPVVAYDVGSIHEINKNEEIVTLVKRLDVEGLVKSILNLLNDEKLQLEKSEKGYDRVIKFVHSNAEIKMDIINAYHKVISEHYKD